MVAMRAWVFVLAFAWAPASSAFADPPTPTRPQRPTLRAIPSSTIAQKIVPADDFATPRRVTVTYKSGVIMAGSIASEDPTALVIDCDLGRLAIPRGRIAVIAYDIDAAPRIPIVEDPARKDAVPPS